MRTRASSGPNGSGLPVILLFRAMAGLVMPASTPGWGHKVPQARKKAGADVSARSAPKRQVKSAKVYVRDSGVLHTLLGIEDRHQLAVHPKSGASWEGFALETVLRAVEPREAYFWATHEGAELDLMLTSRGARWGFEFKRVDAPRATKSMQIARKDLGLREVLVVHPGPGTHRLGDGISAVGLSALGEALAARKLVR